MRLINCLKSTTVYRATKQPQIPNYNITAQNYIKNQIPKVSDTLCEILKDDRIRSSFAYKC